MINFIIRLSIITTFYLACLSQPVHASLITIDILDPNNAANNGLWDITIIEDSSMNIETTLAQQIWWQDSDLAEIFMATTWDSLGYYSQLSDLIMTPYFAVDVWLIPPPMSTTPSIPIASAWSLRQGEDEIKIRSLPGWVNYTFAIATKHTEASEPRTLLLLVISLLAVGLRNKYY